MPTLRFACPFCQKEIHSKDPSQGQKLRCPACGRVAALPAPPPEAEQWFVARKGQKLGPFSWGQLLQLAGDGQLAPADMIWRKGTGKWTPAAAVPGLWRPISPALVPAANATAKPARATVVRRMAAGLGAIAVLALIFVGLAAWLRKSPEDKQPVVAEQSGATAKEVPGTPTGKESAPPPANAAPAAVAKLNHYRRLAGLGMVTLEDRLSHGCQAHALYLSKNTDLLRPGVDLADEHPGRPGFTPEGQEAARHAVVLTAAPPEAIDAGMAHVTSRAYLLRPRLSAMGIGAVREASGRWISVLDVGRGRDGFQVVLYPADRQQNVPLRFSAGPELPDKKAIAGFPVSATFPPRAIVKNAAAVLHDAAGQPVKVWLSTPEKSAVGHGQRNSICLIARALLKPNTTYTVTAQATVDGRAWRRTWTFSTINDAALAREMAARALDEVNAARRQASLRPVTLDADLSKGCFAHAAYLARNEDDPSTLGLGGHDEKPGLPGFSEEGRRTGKASVIAFGDPNPMRAVSGWLATFYHRVPILDPSLQVVGFGHARGRAQTWVTVMDISRGKKGPPGKDVVVFPADGQVDVPLAFSGSESPDPIPEDKDKRAGYPITATFQASDLPTAITGTLTDPAGQAVPVWFSSPEKPANPRYRTHQGRSVCLIAKAPLRPGLIYKVHLEGTKAGKSWQKAWSFTTAVDDSVHEVAQVLKRLNFHRTQAGIAAVRLDADLAAGCAAHARYLLQNRQDPSLKGRGVHDENPKLPGYSAAGKEAGRASDVFFGAPTPDFQVDDLMATLLRRVDLLDPDLGRIGFGTVREPGRGWVCVLDVIRGRGDDRVVIFPADGQKEVPRTGRDHVAGAADRPAGYPITVTFPAGATVSQVAANLHDGNGQPTDVALTAPAGQGQTISLVPCEPLQPGSRYTVTVTARVNGRAWQQAWTFGTAE
jgi:uncharacterized protein YkwD